MVGRSLALAVFLALSGCMEPYTALEDQFSDPSDSSPEYLSRASVSFGGPQFRGAYSMNGLVDVGVSSDFVHIKPLFPVSLFHKPIRIGRHAVAGCTKTCFGEGRSNANLLLDDQGINISISSHREVLDWCFAQGIQPASAAAKRGWMYNDQKLPRSTEKAPMDRDAFDDVICKACRGF